METKRRLIDANDLWSDIMMIPHNGDMISSEEVEQEIQNATTVDAVEVVHGRWVKKWHGDDLIGHEYEECSVCGSCIISDTEKFWDCNYCPNCGADMRGVNDG